MASKIPNLLAAMTLTKDKSFDSSEVITGSLSADGNCEFPLLSYSGDLYECSKNLDEKRVLFLKLLEASCTGLEHIFRSSFTFVKEIINALDECQGASALHYACLNGHRSVVTFLLQNGADVDIWDAHKRATPLICAAAYGHLEIVKLLLNHKCDINAGLNEQSSPLLWAVRRNHPQIVQCLLDHGACQNSVVLYSETPVHTAVINGLPKILEMLINADGCTKADFCMGHQKDTPLHLAASGDYPNSFETCKKLLEQGKVSLNATNANGKTPLHLAAASHEVDTVRLLLSHGANANFVDETGRTPLFYVLSDSSDALKCLRALCEDGKCDVNYQDNQGYTALHLAAFKEMPISAQTLLLNGADFSLKTHDGFSALSILNRKIPTTEKLIGKVFDHAVKVSCQQDGTEETQVALGSRQNCKVKVNFNCVVASQPAPPEIIPKHPSYKYATSGATTSTPTTPAARTVRKETTKIKCLVDENLTNLLLHPVVHSFLVLKWQKARPIFLATFIFKAILVVLFSVYVQLPYINGMKPRDIANYSMESDSNDTSPGSTPGWYVIMYALIVTLATLNGILELAQILRSPRSQLRSLEPWIFVTVLLIMIFYMNPNTWGRTGDLFHRSMAATGICLAWMDVWICMGRFPTFGLSIRVFFKVLQNFIIFTAPHFCMLAGFVLSFTLLFPQDPEFSSIFITFAKAIRIMAGDSELPSRGTITLTPESTTKDIVSHFLVIWIYTAYVLTVGIVLMNMLIGLAVNDIQGIYAQAAINRLKKQTILLNTLDANFNAKWIRRWIPKRFLYRHVNLFPSFSNQNKILTFKPYDSRDSKFCTDLKLALLNITNDKQGRGSAFPPDGAENNLSSPSTINVQRWTDAANKLIAKKDNEHDILLKRVNVLVDKVDLLVETINSGSK